VVAGYPNWLSVISTNNHQSKNGTPDTLTFSVVTANVPAAGSYPYGSSCT